MRSTIHVLVALALATALPLSSQLVLHAPWGRSTAQAQSLADVAREEEARRKDIKQPSKVYTNKDLGNVPPPTPQAVAPPAPPAAATADKGPATAGAATAETAKEPPRDQKYWAGRMQKLREQLDRDQTYAEALQSRINALTADFSARDDPAQRSVIERDRLKALAELDRLQKAVADTKKAIPDLEEEARRQSVPPGWLR